jgi:hypothetical protein
MRVVPDGLTGSADEVHLPVAHSQFSEEVVDGRREQLAQQKIEVADLIDASARRVEQVEDPLAHSRWERIGAECLEPDFGCGAVTLNLRQGRVDTVYGRPGHDPDDAARRLARDQRHPFEAIQRSRASRSRPPARCSSARASSAPIFLFAMTTATLVSSPESRKACTAAGRGMPAAISIIRTALARNFSFVGGMSIMRFE